ncbi:hypothetical protein CHS0354_036914, partial [Potamilus streckersoni]
TSSQKYKVHCMSTQGEKRNRGYENRVKQGRSGTFCTLVANDKLEGKTMDPIIAMKQEYMIYYRAVNEKLKRRIVEFERYFRMYSMNNREVDTRTVHKIVVTFKKIKVQKHAVNNITNCLVKYDKGTNRSVIENSYQEEKIRVIQSAKHFHACTYVKDITKRIAGILEDLKHRNLISNLLTS